jgi:cell division protein ZapA
MAKVEITVNGRVFQVGCEDGQEAHLRSLAARFDSQVSRLAERVGQIGDLRLFLMAGLVACDELIEAENRAKANGSGGKAGKDGAGEAEAAEILARAAERIEALARAAASAS